MRLLLCNWYLEIGDTEGCTNLLRKYRGYGAYLAYSDVLLQCLRWKKDDVVESEVKKTLHNAIMANPYVPDFITGVVTIPKNLHEYYSPGELSEAEDYAMESIPIWKMHAQKKYLGSNVPTEYDLINLLKSGKTFLMKCTHTD